MEGARDALLDLAIQAVDEYLTQGTNDSIYTEPHYNGNINSFLKWEQLGKTADETPRFHSLIARYGTVVGMNVAGHVSTRSLIEEAFNREEHISDIGEENGSRS
jgi:hypothetical protein